MSVPYMLEFDVFSRVPGTASNSSAQSASVITLQHFTSLVINSLCQSSGVIGRTSSPMKRLISMLLCG